MLNMIVEQIDGMKEHLDRRFGDMIDIEGLAEVIRCAEINDEFDHGMWHKCLIGSYMKVHHDEMLDGTQSYSGFTEEQKVTLVSERFNVPIEDAWDLFSPFTYNEFSDEEYNKLRYDKREAIGRLRRYIDRINV